MTTARPQAVRPTAGHVDHIVVGYRSQESLQQAQSDFSDVLGISEWVALDTDDDQAHGVQSPLSGLKLLTPASPNSALQQHLDCNGEGVVSLCITVKDYDEAFVRAAGLGLDPRTGHQPDVGANHTNQIARQAHIGPFAGIDLSIGEFKLTNPVPAGDRPHAGRIDHVVLAYADHGDWEAARRAFTALLDVDDWMDLGVVNDLWRVTVSWSIGIEFACPIEPSAGDQSTDANVYPDGFASLIFGVSDLDSAVERLRQQGREAFHADMPERVFEAYDVAREAHIGAVGGIMVLLGEFVPK